jgi:uncharacterized membrane protein YagU involved in acid resistance
LNFADLLVWGFAATVVLTTILTAGQALGLTRVDLPFLIGSMFVADRDRAKLIGYGVHLINGWLFALVYAAAFETADEAGLLFGMLIGLVHGLAVVVVLMPLMPALHPRMASEGWGPDANHQLQPPGNLALNYGMSTPVLTVFAHVVYGGILGFFYSL